MTDPKTFNLSAAARDLLHKSKAANPHALSGTLLTKIPKTDRDGVLTFLLGHYLRNVAGEMRAAAEAPSETTANSAKSWKVQGVRDGWARILEQRVNNGAEWKFLGDCTADDLRAIADLRRELAAKSLAVADQFTEYAALVEKHDVKRLRDVPREALGSAA